MATNLTKLGRQENRRTSFDVAEVDGYAFLGRDPTNGGMVLTVLSKAEREALAEVGEVPVFKWPKVVPERDIFKPLVQEKPKTEEELQAAADAEAAAKKGEPAPKPAPAAPEPTPPGEGQIK